MRAMSLLLAMGMALLAGCGGEDDAGEGTGPESPPPQGNALPQLNITIQAHAPGAAPPYINGEGGNTVVLVLALDSLTMQPYPQDTSVSATVNGLPMSRLAGTAVLEKHLAILPGEPINIVVSIDGSNYAVNTRQPLYYPELISPAAPAVWNADVGNGVSWNSPALDHAVGHLLSLTGGTPEQPLRHVAQLPYAARSHVIAGGLLEPAQYHLELAVVTLQPVEGAHESSQIVVMASDWELVEVVGEVE